MCQPMKTYLLTHEDFADHVTPDGHPERVERIQAVWAALGDARFDPLIREDAPLVERAHLLRAHPEAYVAAIEAAAPDEGLRSLDPDTHMSPGSLTAARRGAGANIRAVDLVMSGEAGSVFCAVRPPGHHAEKVRAMGFCLFSNAAIAALHAIEAHGLSRVAIMDFDVHHGNGTQDIFWEDDRVMYASTHQFPHYPGTGAASETGLGNIVNAPLAAMTGGREFRSAMEGQILPHLRDFAPELMIISAGFDSHARDPLANLNWVEEDFAWATRELCALARETSGGRVVSTLEGGYDLDGLANSTAVHVEELMAHSEALG